MRYRSAFCTVDDVIRQLELSTASDNDLATAIDTLIATKYANQIARIKSLIFEISDKLNDWCGQSFVPYAYSYTRPLTGMARDIDYVGGEMRLYLDWADDSLLAITTLTWDGTAYASTTYGLGDGAVSPSRYLRLDSEQSWTLYSSTFSASVILDGVWGYHQNYSLLWVSSGDTVQNATSISASGTSLTVTSGNNFETYQYIKIESEWCFITSISSNTLTIERGVLGTIAAIHLNGVAISVMRIDDVARAACRRLVVLEYLTPGETRLLAPLPDGTIRLQSTQESIPLPPSRLVLGSF